MITAPLEITLKSCSGGYQELLRRGFVGEETNLRMVAVFPRQVLERGTVLRGVLDDNRQPLMVVHKLLHQLAGKTRAQIEEIPPKFTLTQH